MTARSVLAAILVSLAVAAPAPAGEFDDDDDMAQRTSLFAARVNETPEQVEALARELGMRQHAAQFTEIDRGEIGRLKRKEEELELRYRIAALRTERSFARRSRDRRQLDDLEQAIHREKQKLAKMQKRHRAEARAEKKQDPFAFEEVPSLGPELQRRDVPEDRI